MKILIASSEMTPFSKTGGLADVIGALPKSLKNLGHDVRVIIPKYKMTEKGNFSMKLINENLEVKIGEKIEISEYVYLTGEPVVAYIHAGAKLGVLVSLKSANGVSDSVLAAGKDVGMQVAAMNPVAVDENSVDKALIDKEMEIAKAQVLAEGKPENMVEKIAQGKVNKFLKENTLLAQAFVKDNSKTVGQYLNEVSKGLTVSAFKRVAIG